MVKKSVLGLAVCCGVAGAMQMESAEKMEEAISRAVKKSASFESLGEPAEGVINRKKRSLSSPVTKDEKRQCLALVPKLQEIDSLSQIVDLLCSDKLSKDDAWDIYEKAYEIFGSSDVDILRNLKMLETIAVDRSLVPFGVLDSSVFWNMYNAGCMDCDIISAPVVDYSY